jgi:hypothetical protein
VSSRSHNANTIKTRPSVRRAKRSSFLRFSTRDRSKGTASRRHRGCFDPLDGFKPDNGKLHDPGLSSEVSDIERRVQGLEADQLLQRYHELVDQRLTRHARPTESFELGRVESRLNAEDEDELSHLASFKKEWQRERRELVTNIERLLTRLKVVA